MYNLSPCKSTSHYLPSTFTQTLQTDYARDTYIRYRHRHLTHREEPYLNHEFILTPTNITPNQPNHITLLFRDSETIPMYTTTLEYILTTFERTNSLSTELAYSPTVIVSSIKYHTNDTYNCGIVVLTIFLIYIYYSTPLIFSWYVTDTLNLPTYMCHFILKIILT